MKQQHQLQIEGGKIKVSNIKLDGNQHAHGMHTHRAATEMLFNYSIGGILYYHADSIYTIFNML